MSAEAFKNGLKSEILSGSIGNFEDAALRLFEFQSQHNLLYAEYLRYRRIRPQKITRIEEIPFLPIAFFKDHTIITGTQTSFAGVIFESSGTTGSVPSHHFVADPGFYLQHATRLYQAQYGSLKDTIIIALLPSYLERQNSSLVYMVNHFIQLTENPLSGFFLHRGQQMLDTIQQAQASGKRVVLWGVTFALLDLAHSASINLSGVTVMETGGMKGRGREPLREELHEQLTRAFGVPSIHSEYGMTELLSQAYASANGLYECPFSMRLLVREPEDPFALSRQGRGGINVIDLANVESCAFIETQDVGEVQADGAFRILGRIHSSEIRGCSLLTA